MSLVSKKICLLGDFGVGKTSLIERYAKGVFSKKYSTTIGVKIYHKLIYPEFCSQKINLIIWDMEGKNKFNSIASNYLKGATGAIIVGDLSRLNTLKHLSAHINLFLEFNPGGVAVVALNKSDLIKEYKLAELRKLYNSWDNAQVIETIITSAMNNSNVDRAFQVLVKNICYVCS